MAVFIDGNKWTIHDVTHYLRTLFRSRPEWRQYDYPQVRCTVLEKTADGYVECRLAGMQSIKIPPVMQLARKLRQAGPVRILHDLDDLMQREPNAKRLRGMNDELMCDD